MNASKPAIKLRPRHPFLFYTSIAAMVLVIGFSLWARGKGYRTWAVRLFRAPAMRVISARPGVQCGQPGDMEENILPETPIAAYLTLPNGPIDPSTLNSHSVRLMRTMDGSIIPSTLELSDKGYKLGLHPAEALCGDTSYTFCITEGLRDVAGQSVEPWATAFKTKTAAGAADPLIRFQPVRLKNTIGHGYTALRVGPDRRLYAATDDGSILRFPIEADGTLGSPMVIDSLRTAWGPRIIIGFCFEPQSTADQLAIWVSHNEPVLENTTPVGGAVSRLSGRSLAEVQDAIVNLPRSFRDHMTNQPAFGPDGALYIPQGSNTASGDTDPTWGNRAEALFSASILRLDITQLGSQPIDAESLENSGCCDPADCASVLSIWAGGIRNAYSLIWHSNGHLYAPTNGSSAGGNTPAGDGAPALTHLPFSEDDYLFDVHRGKYYGHPNPAQGHFVLHGGNPFDQRAPQRITQYPPGTRPDSQWEPAVFNFGKHVSPNGVIEYRGGAFQHHLDHKLLVCRFNLGSDIIAMEMASDGRTIVAAVPVPGLRSLAAPLDLAEDTTTGNLYVSEYGAKRILLARPVVGK